MKRKYKNLKQMYRFIDATAGLHKTWQARNSDLGKSSKYKVNHPWGGRRADGWSDNQKPEEYFKYKKRTPYLTGQGRKRTYTYPTSIRKTWKSYYKKYNKGTNKPVKILVGAYK